MDFQFAYKDWTVKHRPYWKQYLDDIVSKDSCVTFVEVGSFEGRSTVFFADYLQHPDSLMYCIDTWRGGEEIVRLGLPFDMKLVENNFDHNISLHTNCNRIVKREMTSEVGLVSMLADYYSNVNFVYLDGSHTQRDTLVDLVLALCLLKSGGVIIVDDYLNIMATKDLTLRPKLSVEYVAEAFQHEVKFLKMPNPSGQAVFIKY